MQKRLQEYKQHLQNMELSEPTIKIYLQQAQLLEEYLAQKNYQKSSIMEYKKMLEQRNLKVSTRNLYIIAINKYLHFLGYDEYCVKTHRIQKKRSLKNVIQIEEYRKLLDYTQRQGDDKYNCILKTLAGTGIRVSELEYFTVESLNSGIITVSNKGKIREIYLPNSLIKELKTYCSKKHIESGTIFLGRNGNPINRISVYKHLNDMAGKNGIPKERVHPHSLRHMFAIAYMETYHNLSELSDILGHSSLETTRIYYVKQVIMVRNLPKLA